jgi:hypothetical protein
MSASTLAQGFGLGVTLIVGVGVTHVTVGSGS